MPVTAMKGNALYPVRTGKATCYLFLPWPHDVSKHQNWKRWLDRDNSPILQFPVISSVKYFVVLTLVRYVAPIASQPILC